MRDLKKFIFMAAALFLILTWRLYGYGAGNEKIRRFRGASLDQEIWNPLVAQTVNGGKLEAVIGNQKLTNEEDGIYMDDGRNIMIPVAVLEEGFDCSTHIYEQKELLLEKYSDSISFTLGQENIMVNGTSKKADSPMACKEGRYFVPMKTVAENLGFDYDWDIEKNQAVAVDQAQKESILPPKYDLRDRQRAPRVKDQGNFGTCWAFAALSAIESTLLPEEEQEFSPDHMSIRNSFSMEQAQGGEYAMGIAYLTSWQGPVAEKDDPYGDGKSPDHLQAIKHVQEVQLIEGKDFEKVKEFVFKYGGVQTAIYSALTESQYSSYYNKETSAYCYIGDEKPNHEIMIIGWDDNYPKENFRLEAEGDGAFLCQNSWGESFGEEGAFYVSYYDVNIGTHNVIYTGVEEADNYEHIYQSDLCGWVGQLGYKKDGIYGANVYTAQSQEDLKAAGFYATGKDTSYEIFIVSGFTDKKSLKERVLVAEGSVANAGFYTIPFDQSIAVKAGKKFAVVLHVTTPGSVHPLAIEYAADEFTKKADLTDGEGYISTNGNKWENTEQNQKCNLCLKVYSDSCKQSSAFEN